MSNNHESRITRLEVIQESINANLANISKRLDDNFSHLNKKLDKLDEKVDSNFKWVLGVVITLFLTNTTGIIVSLLKIWH